MDTNNTNNCEVQNYPEEICVNVQRIYDTCKDKDCLSDLRVYLNGDDQRLIDQAVNVRARKTELIWTAVNLEAVPFNKGFYAVDMTFFFRTDFEVYNCGVRPTLVEGLSFYNKKVILFGSEGNTATFTSLNQSEYGRSGNLPIAEVEVVEPIVLNTRIAGKGCNCCSDTDTLNLPQSVLNQFCDTLTVDGEKKLLISLGLFSVVRIVRDVQVTIPSSKFCLPEKECCGPREEEPCSFFEKLCFPTNEFFPPEGGNCNCN